MHVSFLAVSILCLSHPVLGVRRLRDPEDYAAHVDAYEHIHGRNTEDERTLVLGREDRHSQLDRDLDEISNGQIMGGANTITMEQVQKLQEDLLKLRERHQKIKQEHGDLHDRQKVLSKEMLEIYQKQQKLGIEDLELSNRYKRLEKILRIFKSQEDIQKEAIMLKQRKAELDMKVLKLNERMKNEQEKADWQKRALASQQQHQFSEYRKLLEMEKAEKEKCGNICKTR